MKLKKVEPKLRATLLKKRLRQQSFPVVLKNY